MTPLQRSIAPLSFTPLAACLLALAGCGGGQVDAPFFFEAPTELNKEYRAEWTDFRPAQPAYVPWRRIVFHHTGQYLPPWGDCKEAARAVLERHTREFGLPDIGFHYLICPDGRVFEGTAGGQDVVGSHMLLPLANGGQPDPEALALSEGSVSIAFLGQFSYGQALAVDEAGNPRLEWGRPVIEVNRPTPEAIRAAAILVAWLAEESGIDVASQEDGANLVVSPYQGRAEARPYTSRGVVPHVSHARLHWALTGALQDRPAPCSAEEVAQHDAAGTGPCKGKQPGQSKGDGWRLPPRYEELNDPGEEVAMQMGAIRLLALERLGRKPEGAWEPLAAIQVGDTTPSTLVPARFTRPPLGLQLRPRSEYARWREGDRLPSGAQVGDVIPFNGTPEFVTWERLVMHHTALHSEGRTCLQLVEETFRLHRFGNNYSDVGYHFLICPDGTVYTGRGEAARGVRGAHAFGFNHNTAGISLLGQMASEARYETIGGRQGLEAPTRAALESAGRLIAWLSVELNRPLDTLVPGAQVSNSFGQSGPFRPRVAVPFIGWHGFYGSQQRGHGNWQQDPMDNYYYTACPGDLQLDALGYVRAVAERWRALY